MRRQHLMVGLGQTVIFGPTNGAGDDFLPQPAPQTLRHPGGHDRFIGRCAVEIFRQHPNAAPRRDKTFRGDRALRHFRGDIHGAIADTNHQHVFAAHIMRCKRRVIVMAVHLDAVKIIAIFGRRLGVPMMPIGNHQRAILARFAAAQFNLPKPRIIAPRIGDAGVESDVVA